MVVSSEPCRVMSMAPHWPVADVANPALLRKLDWARQQRQEGKPTVPSTVGEERQHNLFLRCGEPALQQALLGAVADEAGREEAEAAALAELRRRKDHATWSASLVSRLLPIVRWLGLGP